MFDIRELKRRLRVLRSKYQLTQAEVAAYSGLDYKFYQQIESPRKKQIWLDTVNRLVEVYRLELWQFFHPDFASFASKPKAKR